MANHESLRAVNDLISEGELEDDMLGMITIDYDIKIVYHDQTLKQVKSSKLKRLD